MSPCAERDTFRGGGDAGEISFSKDLVAFVHSVELNFIGPEKYSGVLKRVDACRK